MSITLSRLNELISSIAPIHGVSIGRWDDRTSWRIDFKNEATELERSAALSSLNNFDQHDTVADEMFEKDMRIDALDIATLQVVFNHENRIRALENRPTVSLSQFKNAIKSLM